MSRWDAATCSGSSWPEYSEELFGKKARGADLPAALMPKSAVKISAAQSVCEDKTTISSACEDAL
jgi:hypothetical protein